MLQQIRARKMNRYAQREQEALTKDEDLEIDGAKDLDNDIEVDSSDSSD